MRFRPLSSNSVLPFDAGCTRHGGAAGLTVRRFAALSAPSAAPRGAAGVFSARRAGFPGFARLCPWGGETGGAGVIDSARPAYRAAA